MELIDVFVPVLILSIVYTLLFTAGRPGESEAQNKRAKRSR
jgi:hypothetical protein